MFRRLAPLAAASVFMLIAGPALAAPVVNPATRTATIGPFVVRWSLANPEAITYLSWNNSTNLTNAWAHPNCETGGVHEYFGNSWGGDDAVSFLSPVGWGSAGSWAAHGSSGVDIASAASGCYGTSGIPVATSYGFFGATAALGRIQVERRFSFGSTPFAADFRPYIPRLYPLDRYSEVLFPNATATALLTRQGSDCGLGCRVIDWSGTWFAINDPRTGQGMIVRHEPSSHPAALWLDEDGGSFTSASSVVLLQTGSGFTGTVVDRQVLCFYDASIWTPSLALPAGCAVAWTELPPVGTSKLGLPSAPGPFTPDTKISALRKYVTWQANLGPAASNRTVAVLVAVKKADGTFSAFNRLTGRVADASGIVTFSWRESTPKWLAVRFAFDDILTIPSQARWR
jgi:hypothetical protein